MMYKLKIKSFYSILLMLVLLILTLSMPFEESKAESWTIGHIQTFVGNTTIAGLGDINGDGYDDVGVTDFYIDSKRVFIYFGSNNINSEPDLIMETPYPIDDFGCAISSAGDVNNDGYVDMIIGAYNSDMEGQDSGRAYIYFGGSDFDNTPDVILNGTERDFFGWSVSPLYDINKDGYDDVIVGAPQRDNTGSHWDGSAYIFYGGDPMDTNAVFRVDGNRTCLFGYSVSSAGDINNDGWLDFIVGEPGNNDEDIGTAYIYFGGNNIDNISDINLTNGLENDKFGQSVSSAGDFNGDGSYDIVVGAPWNDDKDITAGKAYLYLGGPSIDNISDYSWEGKESGSEFGGIVTNYTDLNNDGYDEIIISSLTDGTIEVYNSGAIYIYYGDEDFLEIKETTVYGLKSFEIFGSDISSGDVNGDGYRDILVASKKNGYAFGPNFPPSMEIIEPDGISDLVDTYYTITWDDEDPDDNATISLFYLPTFESTPILIEGAEEIKENDETDEFVWNTSQITGGSYYIRAKIDDGVNPVVWANSTGMVTINHHPVITITAPGISNILAYKTFTITWTDIDDEDNATISLYFDTDNTGNDGTLIVSGIGEDDELDLYVWNTTDMQEGDYYIYAEIDDGINPVYINYSVVPLTIHHKISNLSITEILFNPSSPKDKDKVEIKATILNSGDKEVNNIAVKLLVDGLEMDEINIEKILPDNGTFEVMFDPITLEKGSYTITVRVNYDDKEIEEDEILEVKERPPTFPLIPLIILIVIIVIVVLIIALLISKRKRGTESKNIGVAQVTPSMEQISCPQCQNIFYVPTGSSPLQVQCPNCGAKGLLK